MRACNPLTFQNPIIVAPPFIVSGWLCYWTVSSDCPTATVQMREKKRRLKCWSTHLSHFSQTQDNQNHTQHVQHHCLLTFLFPDRPLAPLPAWIIHVGCERWQAVIGWETACRLYNCLIWHSDHFNRQKDGLVLTQNEEQLPVLRQVLCSFFFSLWVLRLHSQVQAALPYW